MTEPTNLPMALGSKGIVPANVTELQSLAQMMVAGGLFKGSAIEAACVIGMGAELGLSPFQAIQVIKSINGKFSVFGDGITGLLHASGKLAEMTETITGDGDSRTATCRLLRHGMAEPVIGRFSVSDAKRAGLWGKQGPWQSYPDRMLTMRARGFAARDGFSDVLRGLISAEEAQDYPTTVRKTLPLPGTVVSHDDHKPHIQEPPKQAQGGARGPLMDSWPPQAPKTAPEPVQGESEAPQPWMHPAQQKALREGLKLPPGVPSRFPVEQPSKFVESLQDSRAEFDQAKSLKLDQALVEKEHKTYEELKTLVGQMCLEMSAGDKQAAGDLLEFLSGFEGRDGVAKKGFRTLKGKIPEKWLAVTYGKVCDAHEKWLAERVVSTPTEERPPSVSEEPELAPFGLSPDGEPLPF